MMRRRRVLAFVTGAATLLGAGLLAVPGAAAAAGAHAAAVQPDAAWGRAIPVPGLAALNKGGNANVLSVSCPSAGKCAAGGFYQSHGKQGFVVNKRNGSWKQAIQVPGLGTLNKGGPAQVTQVACASGGNCAAGGFYRDGAGHRQGFVAVQVNGSWHRAIQVPGLATLNKGGSAAVNSVSCVTAGNCAAAGAYTDGAGHQQGFVAVEVNGGWRQAIQVPGLGTLNKGGNAGVNSVSCGSAANCSAGGHYTDASSHSQAFVVSEKNGSWGTALQVAGVLNVGGQASVNSVSCASA
ncbi:MAG: hypothetical protein LBV34_13940, partial [Nocardiopsaceae bacterium]|nr:hypothetical protein [Nocardiopsaceae bacterium]